MTTHQGMCCLFSVKSLQRQKCDYIYEKSTGDPLKYSIFHPSLNVKVLRPNIA